ncbi:amidohydrolase [Pseudonocardia thermophila]|uniref:amidohydrolase n=1 Tax=Pseudonocardia thermophila TaxID=1848 RepID=UPI00248D63D4|nr:amidohydrolase family protein [Pseudonocardia thermophila]
MSGLIIRGDVHTRDPACPRVEAVGIAGGTIAALGTAAEAAAALPGAELLDLGGHVLPGFVDTHVHAQWLGRSLSWLVLDDATSIGEIQRRLRAAADAEPGDTWIQGDAGFSITDLAEGRLPTADELEAAVPGRPVFLDRRGHDALINRTAARIAGLGDDHDGLLQEHAQVDRVRRHVPAPDEATRRRWVAAGTAELRRHGITRAQDPAVTADDFDVWVDAHRRGEVHVRMTLMPLGGPDVAPQALHARAAQALAGVDPAFLARGPAKLFLDGGGSLGTAMRHRPWPRTGSSGVQSTPTETLRAYAAHAAATGEGLGVHAVGDAAIDLVVDVAIETGACRSVHLIHAYLAPTDAAIRRCAEHGIAVSAHPALYWQVGPDLLDQLPEEEVAASNPLRRWLDAGVTVLGGSDAPGPPVGVLFGMWQARSRRVRGHEEPLGPELAVTAEEALAMFTPDPLRVGGPADLAVIDVDPLHPDPGALLDGSVLATVVAGRVTEFPQAA